MHIRQRLQLRSFSRLPNNGERHDVPQVYRTHGERAAGMHWLFREAVEACRARWNGVEVTVEAQCAVSQPGSTPGLPIWHRLPGSATGEVAIACLGSSALLQFHEHDVPAPGESDSACGERLAGDSCAISAPAGATVRFRDHDGPPSDHLGGQSFFVVLLVRPLDDGPVPDRHACPGPREAPTIRATIVVRRHFARGASRSSRKNAARSCRPDSPAFR